MTPNRDPESLSSPNAAPRRVARGPIAALLGAVVIMGIVLLTLAPAHSLSADADLAPLSSPEAKRSIEIAEALSDAFANVADAVAPSVVSVRTTDAVTIQQRSPFPQLPDEFRRFFGDDFFSFSPFGQQNPQPQRQLRQGQGSGFVYSADGHIVTNNHVVADADEITVIFTDGRTYTAELVGADPQTDIAVIRIHADDLVPLTLGDSDSLRVGQFVVAAGSPFGLSSTITTGVVSATGRNRIGINDLEDFIQTDAAVNPGNSGGPLVNLRGEVIGVNSAIATRTGANVGVGFAIPVNMVRTVADTLIADGRVTRGRLGVTIQDLTPDLARSFGYTGTRGALIAGVEPGSPAAEAGFESGDIITEVNGAPVGDAAELRLLVADLKPGELARFAVFRGGKSLTLRPTIGAASENDSPVAAASAQQTLSDKLGAAFETLTSELASRIGLPAGTSGALVRSVDPIGAAARAGLRAGDVITRVGDERIESLADLNRALTKDALRTGVRLTVHARGGVRFVFLHIDDGAERR